MNPTALIADDEPLLRHALVRLLAQAWPELDVIAQARNGREAVEYFEAKRPDICFLDVRMPGMSGVEAARFIGNRAQLVFVTAYDQYAVQAFEQGALDYLVKPVESVRLTATVARLKERLRLAEPGHDMAALLDQLEARLRKGSAPANLHWVRVSVGRSLRLVAVSEIDYLRSEAKYTLVAWRSGGEAREGLIRTPLKELASQIDPTQFARVHRSAIVNLRSVDHVTHGENETASIYLKGRTDVLPVSRSYLHLFRQM
ncbi:MAG: LytTR family DNA-binding domain-containing protein [Gammaproteobacteria bacterium]|nr:LytTR family DNA-binding domain-containing protein [Nitrococcus sp.]MDN5864139.1 LytTR family DNA-binding domain-containing protein [Gammaproteobacteria bacterium]